MKLTTISDRYDCYTLTSKKVVTVGPKALNNKPKSRPWDLLSHSNCQLARIFQYKGEIATGEFASFKLFACSAGANFAVLLAKLKHQLRRQIG